LKDRFLVEIGELIDSGAFTNGPQVEAFEHEFASFCGAKTCVGVASGLDGLRLALLAAGIEQGDEVIVPAHTFFATFEAVTQAGGVPVVVDVSERDYGIDAAAAAAAVTPRTRFLLPVHLYGQMADMAALVPIAEWHGLEIVEDACQAHGAERDGRRAGTSGVAAAFSFYPGKNLGAIGDAGAVVTSDDGLASRVRTLREHGQHAKYEHEVEGYTARLDTIQALALLLKLPSLERWNEERRDVARFYSAELGGVGDLGLPPLAPGSRHVWHLYTIRTAHVQTLGEFLRLRGIQTGRHYPQPPHLAPPYRWLGYGRGAFPVAEALAQELLSLPIYPGISEEQCWHVVSSIRSFFADG
jgi:dTDP-3-amino-3,4,6-trideoxy-alpha-D-glucose transaminase